MYSSKTNKMQRYTILFIITNVLNVSGGSFTNHQELKTVYTASGICRAFSAFTAIVSELELTIAVSCVYSFALLMMGEGTA
jgi:hypothetical protein